MPSRWRRSLRITRRTLAYSGFVLLILAAFLVSIANLFLPYIEKNPERVQAWLSNQVGQPVHYRSSKSQWTRRGPRIELIELRVGQGDAAVEISRAELLVAVYSGFLPNHPLTELKVKNLKLRLQQQADDSWQLLGVPRRENSKTDPLDVLSGFGELQVERASLRIQANGRAEITIPRFDVRLRVQGQQLKLGARAQAKIGEAPLFAVAKLNRRDYSGTFWLGGKQLSASTWLNLLPVNQRPKLSAQLRLDVWATLKQRQLTRLHGQLSATDVRKHALPITGLALSRVIAPRDNVFDGIEAKWQWQRNEQGWQAQLQSVDFVNGDQRDQIKNVQIASSAKHWRAYAERIDMQALSRLASELPQRLPKWADAFSPLQLSGQLSGLAASGRADFSRFHVSGRAKALSIKPVGKAPGFSGVAGAFSADERGGSWQFSKGAMQLDWPQAFGRRIESRVDGSLQWWRSGQDWVLGTQGLGWSGDGIGLDVDAQMQFVHGRKLPQLFLAARLPDFDFSTAKRFWPQHVMPKASIDWLNMALVSGQVRDGSALIAGDLADWPFDSNRGRFKAAARVQAKQFKFAADWPAADKADLLADFNGPGFTAIGSANFLGNRLVLKPSGIPVFKQSELRVAVSSQSDLSVLLPVLQKTPLKTRVGSPVTALRGTGKALVNVDLFLPLKKGAAFNAVKGDVQFTGSTIRSPDWNLTMAAAEGAARFDGDGFSAENVRGLMERTPVFLNVRVGTKHVKDASQYIQASIRGNFSSDTILRYHADLADLKTVLKGVSPWQFDVNVPKVALQNQAPVFLTAQSSLQGTSIGLPAPLAKPAEGALSLSMRTQLPIDRGVIDVRIGQAIRLMLKKPLHKPMSGIAMLGAQTSYVIPESGFSVRGTAEEFDAPAWLALANKAESGIALQDFDLNVNHMRLLGQDFGVTRLQITPGTDAMTVKAEGPRLDGQIIWPKAIGQTVSARFARVHFLTKAKGTDAVASDVSTQSLDLGNPSLLPPLQLRIEDARIGALLFGRVDLQTLASKQGLLIQKFSTQSPMLASTASGLWQGNGKQARTSLQAVVTSPDLGKVLSALQFNDVMQRGKTTVKLSGVWPSSPLDFNPVNFTGAIEMAVAEGQFPEVKAGGGRLLGFMSLAELPRRLSLNFNDLTDKGLGFNSIKGEILFAQGLAKTRNLRIDAPAADILISGSTDLINQRFDQTVQVQPKAGGLLPVIGAATAGPIGAAAGVVAQAVLNKPLKESSAIEYRITGPWLQPEVVKQSGAKQK